MFRSTMHWIFAICLVMGLLLVAMLSAETVPNGAGLPHPELPGMRIGGDGAARLEHIGTFAFLFQSLLLLLVVCLALLGVAERNRSPQFFVCMAASYAFMLYCGWQMYFGHQAFLASGETGYFMGFPTATAWQVYGTWFGAIPLILIYTIGFRKYIYTAEDEAEFNKLVAEARRSPLAQDSTQDSNPVTAQETARNTTQDTTQENPS